MTITDKLKRIGRDYVAPVFLGATLALNMASCQREEPKHVVPAQTETTLRESREPYTVTAFDGSVVLVIPDRFQNGAFRFYRDRDDDGYADTKGKGFYMFDLSRTLSEDEIPQGKYAIDKLKEEYSSIK